MESLIETFHLDVKLIIAQLVNFLIVAGVLYFFALKPLTKIMNERTAKIEKSLREAKEIEDKVQLTEVERDKILKQARAEAKNIVEKANNSAEDKRQQILNNAKKEMENIISEGKKQINNEKETMLKEVKSEIVELVVTISQKVFKKEISEEINKDLIKDTLEEIKK